MPAVHLQGGMRIEIPNREENREDVAHVMDQRELVQARGTKWMRLPELYGTASSNVLTMDESHGVAVVGPEQGYAWSLRRIVIDGMTNGTTPDIVNMYRNSVTGAPLWQFNGNNFGYTFGRLEMTLMGGDTLKFASPSGFSFQATGRIRVSGELVEVPAEMLWKMVS